MFQDKRDWQLIFFVWAVVDHEPVVTATFLTILGFAEAVVTVQCAQLAQMVAALSNR